MGSKDMKRDSPFETPFSLYKPIPQTYARLNLISSKGELGLEDIFVKDNSGARIGLNTKYKPLLQDSFLI